MAKRAKTPKIGRRDAMRGKAVSFVRCMLCVGELKIVSGVHLAAHGYTRDDYMEAFGLSPDQLICDETRLKQSRRPDYVPYHEGSLKEALRGIYRSEGHLDWTTCRRKYPALALQTHRLFSGWETAVRSAGYDPDLIRRTQKWSPEKILDLIRFRQVSGQPLHGPSVHDSGDGIADRAAHYFGSWRAAVRAAGISLEEAKVKECWSKERILREIRDLGSIAGLKPGEIQKRWTKLSKAAIKRFGSTRAAIQAAGIDLDVFYGKRAWSKERVIEEIQMRFAEGKSVNATDTLKQDPRLRGAAQTYFRNWTTALEAAGIDPESVARQESWSKEKILLALVKLAESGEPAEDYRFIHKNHPALLSAIYRHFGNWDSFLRAFASNSVGAQKEPHDIRLLAK